MGDKTKHTGKITIPNYRTQQGSKDTRCRIQSSPTPRRAGPRRTRGPALQHARARAMIRQNDAWSCPVVNDYTDKTTGRRYPGLMGGRCWAWLAPTYKLLLESMARGGAAFAPIATRTNASGYHIKPITGGLLEIADARTLGLAHGCKCYRTVVCDQTWGRRLRHDGGRTRLPDRRHRKPSARTVRGVEARRLNCVPAGRRVRADV